MKILITGATGLIGSQIVEDCLRRNIKINFLTTSKRKINSLLNCQGFYWDPEKNIIDLSCFEGVSVIINLSGASIFRFWTKKNKIKIDSIVSASGIGAYPTSYDKEYDENEIERSKYFLADVIKEWEQATNSFSEIIKSVSIIRIGLVLSKKGGVLKQTIQPMSFGFGIYFGSGKQWQSWIHIKDISRIFMHVASMKLNGIYNGVAPNPISNFTFTKTISKIRGYVYFLIPVPKLFFKIIFGKMHTILFKSQKISSEKIVSSGYKFHFTDIESALINILK